MHGFVQLLCLWTIEFTATTSFPEPEITLIHSAVELESRLLILLLIKRT